MWLEPRRLILLALGLLIVGCRHDLALTPAVSGSIKFKSSADQKSLSAGQITSLEAWFQSNRTGWESSPVTYARAFEFSLVHQDGDKSAVNLSDTGFIVVNNKSGQFIKQLTVTELSQLRSIVGY
jgi:hypothetical protein